MDASFEPQSAARDDDAALPCLRSAALPETIHTDHVLRLVPPPSPESARERLMTLGATALSNAELLALVLKTGNGAQGQSAMDVAAQLLQLAEDRQPDSPLVALRYLSVPELQTISGIGEAKAAMVVAALELGKRVFHSPPPRNTHIETPEAAVAAFTIDLMWARQEKFAVLLLDVKNRLLKKEVLTVGSATETLAPPRDIFRLAVQHGGATRLVVAHNHPSGSVEPSPEDLALTKALIKAGKIMDIPIMDHLILGGGAFRSVRATTDLWETYR